MNCQKDRRRIKDRGLGRGVTECLFCNNLWMCLNKKMLKADIQIQPDSATIFFKVASFNQLFYKVGSHI